MNVNADTEWMGSSETRRHLGMAKSSFYRIIKKLQSERDIPVSDNSLSIHVIPIWGGVKYPGQAWQFRRRRIKKWLETLADSEMENGGESAVKKHDGGSET